MIDLKTLIYIIIGLITIGTAVVTFFNMQTRQNMKIDQLQKEVKDLKIKLSGVTSYQIKTEKDIVEISTKLDSLMDIMKEIKEKGCGRNCI